MKIIFGSIFILFTAFTPIAEGGEKEVQQYRECLSDAQKHYKRAWKRRCLHVLRSHPKCKLPSRDANELNRMYRDMKDDCYREAQINVQ